MTCENPRLDILLYAHDGRGLGHASRAIAIGMALRRCSPSLRVLFVSGCRLSGELIGTAPLDWLKLPSYRTTVTAGKSRGATGHSMFDDRELGRLRATQLEQLVRLYRPRLVLCDHTPQGKHRELVPALAATASGDTRWVLGVRGVVGSVAQVSSELARQVFAAHYHGLFWYGDSSVLGEQGLHQLATHFGRPPLECGYVSRMAELMRLRGGDLSRPKGIAGTIAIPWLGEGGLTLARHLAAALVAIGPDRGMWRLFVDGETDEARRELHRLFGPLNHCRLEPPSGSRYIEALLDSRSALVYGGYNSVMDVLCAGVPAVVVLREMEDSEQQTHLAQLSRVAGERLSVIAESAAAPELLVHHLLASLRVAAPLGETKINICGAEVAAAHLAAMLQETRP